MFQLLNEIRAAVSLPITDENLNKEAIMDLYDGFFGLKSCRSCQSGWQSAYLMLKHYVKNIDMSTEKNTYQFISEAKGASVVIPGAGVFNELNMTDDVFEKYIRGTAHEALFIVASIKPKKEVVADGKKA